MLQFDMIRYINEEETISMEHLCLALSFKSLSILNDF